MSNYMVFLLYGQADQGLYCSNISRDVALLKQIRFIGTEMMYSKSLPLYFFHL